MAEVSMLGAVTMAMARAMEDDPDVVVIGEDVGVNGGVFRATEGLLERFGEERVLDTRLAETVLGGVYVGLAAQGFSPVAEFEVLGFIYPDPVMFFEPTRLYRAQKEEVDDNGQGLPLDVCFTLREGKDVTLVSWGASIRETLAAANALAAEGISAEVIDLATISPIDFDTILRSVEKTGRLVIVHEAPRNCGVGAEIAACVAERGLLFLQAPVERVTAPDTVVPLLRLEETYIPS